MAAKKSIGGDEPPHPEGLPGMTLPKSDIYTEAAMLEWVQDVGRGNPKFAEYGQALVEECYDSLMVLPTLTQDILTAELGVAIPRPHARMIMRAAVEICKVLRLPTPDIEESVAHAQAASEHAAAAGLGPRGIEKKSRMPMVEMAKATNGGSGIGGLPSVGEVGIWVATLASWSRANMSEPVASMVKVVRKDPTSISVEMAKGMVSTQEDAELGAIIITSIKLITRDWLGEDIQ